MRSSPSPPKNVISAESFECVLFAMLLKSVNDKRCRCVASHERHDDRNAYSHSSSIHSFTLIQATCAAFHLRVPLGPHTEHCAFSISFCRFASWTNAQTFNSNLNESKLKRSILSKSRANTIVCGRSIRVQVTRERASQGAWGGGEREQREHQLLLSSLSSHRLLLLLLV